MINVSTITEAAQNLLIAQLGSSYKVDRGQYINMDHSKTPWVGVYKGDVKTIPTTLGRGARNWKATVTIKVIVQAANYNADAEQADNDLEGYIKNVIDAFLTDTTIGGTVLMIVGINIDYRFNETDSEDLYFPEAEVSIITEVRTS